MQILPNLLVAKLYWLRKNTLALNGNQSAIALRRRRQEAAASHLIPVLFTQTQIRSYCRLRVNPGS